MLTKVLTLVLVVLIGLALGIETARYVHAHATGVDVSGVVNIHHALGFSLLATSGALLLSLSREWLSRQWTRFTVWLELTLDGLLDFNSLDVGDGLGSIGVSTSSALSESVRGRRLMKPYDLRFVAGSAGELRREMDASIGPMYKRIDTHLAKAVADARAARYPELYEAADSSRKERELDEAVRDIITALGDPCTDDRAWRRLGFIGRSMLVEVVPTIAAYWPPGLAAASAVRASLDTWLSSLSAPVVIKNLPKRPLAPQALSEAMIVVEEAARLLERSQSPNALSEILNAILQGYALFPGSEGRRELFDWWLEDVVPAAADLQVPPPFGRRVKAD